jgi:type III restriction enzyme
MIKRLIFDLDNTLIMWKKEYSLYTIKLLDSFNKKYDKEYLKKMENIIDNYSDLERLSINQKGLKTIVIKFRNIENHIFRKAVNIKAKQENSFFQFEVLKKELEIDSMEDLKNDNFFGDFDIKIILNNDQKYEDISNDEKLSMVLKFLDSITAQIKNIINPKVGSNFIPIEFKKIFFEPKTKVVKFDEESNRISYGLEKEKWYVLDSFYGTSEEKELINICDKLVNLAKYKGGRDNITVLLFEGER